VRDCGDAGDGEGCDAGGCGEGRGAGLEHLKGVIDSGLRDGEGECTEGGALVDYGSLMGEREGKVLT